jgi:hypothetical protein
MATSTAGQGGGLLEGRPAAVVRRHVSRRRSRLASTLEITLEPAMAPKQSLSYWPRIPYPCRIAIAEPMQEIISLLRDPDVEFPDEALERALALATHPASPAFGPYPIQARFAAYSLLDDLRPTDGTTD